MFILGINEAIGAAAVLLNDGHIIAGALEERFTRLKNQSGFPTYATAFCLKKAGIKAEKIDLVVLSYADPYPHFMLKKENEHPDIAPAALRYLRDTAPKMEYMFPPINFFTDFGRNLYYKFYEQKNQRRQADEIAKKLHISAHKIVRIDHHLCHALSGYYSSPLSQKEPLLVFTNDGAGDQTSASVSIMEFGKQKILARTPHTHSLGLFYSAITGHLGFKAHEEEYKIMGLAPYGKSMKSIIKVFEKLIWIEELAFNSSIPSRQYGLYLYHYLRNERFDNIAASTQKYFETLLCTWIKNAISRTNIQSIVCSGGSFLNVKANMEILRLPVVKKAFFMPSCGDDSNAIGAAYFGYIKESTKKFASVPPLQTVYFGPSFSDSEIKNAIRKIHGVSVLEVKNISVPAAKLLAQGEVVARFSGEMEFGARGLGNRSILADPRKSELVEQINHQIKMRDFWMPFAPSILEEMASKYIVNPKKITAPFMIVAFATTSLGKKVLKAAMHPYDKTVRPHIVSIQDNPKFYALIKEFKRITGIGALLNTSFNLHGEPLVCTPTDALSTFLRSDLKYLVMENLLISKKVYEKNY